MGINVPRVSHEWVSINVGGEGVFVCEVSREKYQGVKKEVGERPPGTH